MSSLGVPCVGRGSSLFILTGKECLCQLCRSCGGPGQTYLVALLSKTVEILSVVQVQHGGQSLLSDDTGNLHRAIVLGINSRLTGAKLHEGLLP